MRLLNLFARRALQAPHAPARRPVGEDFPPEREIVRFRALPSHSFSAAAISSFAPANGAGQDERYPPPQMVVSFMGLTGPSGVLPQHYTQLVIDRVRHKDFALRDFLDLFNHRTVSLFYRAWEKYRFPFAYERAALDQEQTESDLFTACVFCLVGCGTKGLRNRLDTPDETFLYYAGQFAHFPRSTVSLEGLVCDYFELPAEVRQFFGQWLYLRPEDQTCMPSAGNRKPCNNQLGVTALLGDRVWGVENKFRLRLGPLSYAQFRRFTPGGDQLVALCQLVRSYVGADFDFDVQLLLKAEEVPLCHVGSRDGTRLGWDTWVHAVPFERNVDDAVFAFEGWPRR